MRIFKNAKGFTLVEMLIVLALIGIMLAISVPSIVNQMSHQRLIRTTRDLFSEINAARINAITRNVKYEVDVNGTTFQLKYFNSGTGAWVNEPGHAAVSAQAKVNITAPSGAFQVVYNPNGTVSAALICLENAVTPSDKLSIQFTGSLGKISIVSGC